MSSYKMIFLITTLMLALICPLLQYYYSPSHYSAYAAVSKPQSNKAPTINDSNLRVEVVFRGGGLKLPTSMAFLGPDDILVLEKNKGKVQRIINGKMLPHPILDVNVATKEERGMLGIAVSKHQKGSTYVFLYYTEAAKKDGDDVTKGKAPLGNRLYRYELVNNKLVNPKLLLSLPVSSTGYYNGGKIIIGPDNNIYLIIGDIQSHQTKTQNYLKGSAPDGRSGILRVTQDGKPVGNGIIGSNYHLNLYYAYGIRNSFGMDFDPITKKLWDTENGPAYGDEINLVERGFNSGWRKVQGIWQPNYHHKLSNGFTAGNIALLHPGNNNNNLVNFDGKGKYSPPEFVWKKTVGPTAIKFLNSDKLGKGYENDVFVGSVHGYLYHFDLNKKRTQLTLKGQLDDKVANNTKELQNIIFGQGFGAITDIQVGPDDGYLYVVSISYGAIYRIAPVNEH